MCGRYTLISNAEAIRRFFELPPFDERLVVPRYNIAPTQPIAVVRCGARGRELLPMLWGLIPAWFKNSAAGRSLINARAEGILAKPAFKNAFRRRRCLVPASGFYEWQVRGKGAKQPFAIHPAATELIAFAGLWETWCGNDGSEIDTAAIVTVSCNECLRALHDRMPAVVDPADFEAWLSPDTEPETAAALLRPAPEALFACRPVSTRVNQAANDDATLWETLSDPPDALESPPSASGQLALPLR